MTSSSRRSLYLTLGGHEVHVSEWGKRDAPALVMWHGMARTGRDFDTIAAQLSDRWRIICPDTLGRGLSGWSNTPDEDYTLSAYSGHTLEMLDKLEVKRLSWVGTSMGGALGMVMAAGPLRDRIDRMVINDIGPTRNPKAMERIRAYVMAMPSFRTMVEVEAFFRNVYAPFGPLNDAEWRHLTETSVRRRGDGLFTVHYDPRVMQVFVRRSAEFDLWPAWDAITCPTLVLRGALSDLLLPEVAEEMTQHGPKAQVVEIPGCGHAPYLNTPDQIKLVAEFLG